MARYKQATIAELAKHGNMDPAKLLACVRETFPRTSLTTRTTGEGVQLALSNYKQKHGIKSGGPAPQSIKPVGGTAQTGSRDQFQHNRGNTMNDDRYDEYAVDAESEKQWKADAGIRAEFHNDFESFKHFRRAESMGLIKFQGGRQYV